MNIFGGMKILCVFFFLGGGGGGGVITKLDYRGHFFAFLGQFLRSRYRMEDIFGLLEFQIFLGCLKFLIFFGGRCWANLRMKKKSEYPPWACDTGSSKK